MTKLDYYTFLAVAGVSLGFFLHLLGYYTGVVYAKEPEPPRVVLIGTEINWTEERIIREIEKHLPAYFVDIARCESGLRPDAVNKSTDDYGLLQINAWYWREDWERMGLDIMNPADNVQMAAYVYKMQGVSAWDASRHCWLDN